ncbi:MAG: SDR family oxidoreductase [Deltaproteobacteria bacterium]|nr:SDR family oxidoreductase [Deltaproteobacteria bacterium]
MQLKGVRVLITGAGRRVGKVLALTLAQSGARLVVHYHRSRHEAQMLRKQILAQGGEVVLVQGDLSKEASLQLLAQKAWQAFGGLDVLINNASNFYPTPLGKTKFSEWDDLFAVNARAPYFLSQSLGLKMKKRGRGKIINIADWAALRPYTGYIPYCAAKAALVGLSQGLAKSLAPEVQVNTVLPGPVMWPADLGSKVKKEVLAKTPLKCIGRPEDIANTVKFLIEGTDYMTGALVHVDGGRSIL